MQQVDINVATESLAELIEAAIAGEEVVITQDSQPLVKLSPIAKTEPKQIKPGSAKGMIWMSDDFDEPLEDFKDYM